MRHIALYPDAAMGLAISRAIIVESSRGGRFDKLKQSHKIDVVVALSMAALAAVRGQNESSYNTDWNQWVTGDDSRRTSEGTYTKSNPFMDMTFIISG